MSLTKDDLKEIKKIVDGSVNTAIEKSEIKMSDKIEFAIEKSEQKMEAKIERSAKETEDKIIGILSKEISDLAEINRDLISKSDNHEHRIIKVERKLGIRI